MATQDLSRPGSGVCREGCHVFCREIAARTAIVADTKTIKCFELICLRRSTTAEAAFKLARRPHCMASNQSRTSLIFSPADVAGGGTPFREGGFGPYGSPSVAPRNHRATRARELLSFSPAQRAGATAFSEGSLFQTHVS